MPLDAANARQQGHAEAYRDYERLRTTPACGDSAAFPALRPTETYAEALTRLPRATGLLLEALRALHRDVPYVTASAAACATRGEMCASFLLDEVMGDYEAAFTAMATPRLRGIEEAGDPAWRARAASHFRSRCDPRRAAEKATDKPENVGKQLNSSAGRLRMQGHAASSVDRAEPPARKKGGRWDLPVGHHSGAETARPAALR